MPPPFVTYATHTEYLDHYKRVYCRQAIHTADGIRVFFGEQKFWHAFYERNAAGKKDTFSPERAKYIDWIKATLENAKAENFQGWNSDTRSHEKDRRVCVVFESFVVVLEMKLKKNGDLVANFITAFYADRSIEKIRTAPPWDRAECFACLKDEN